MKVLVPAWSFFPAQEGGPSNAIYWMASGLATAGYDVHVVTTNRYIYDNSIVFNKWLNLNGFEVIYQTLDNDSQVLFEQIEWCDIMMSNGVCRIIDFYCVLKALHKGKRVILSPRGELNDSAIDHKGRVYGALKRIFFFFMRMLFSQRVEFHATSDDEAGYVRKYMGKACRLYLVPNYMILPQHIPSFNQSRNYFLYVGRLNPIKNIDVLIKGLSESDCFMKGSYVLKIAGEKNNYYDYLKSLCVDLGMENKVVFLGMVTGEEKNELYSRARCLFLVSKSENFGNVIIEGLAQGTPAIASKGTPWFCLEQANAGFWVDATPQSISNAVNALLMKDDNEYEMMRDSAYSLSRSFDIYTNLDKWISVLGPV